MADEEIKQPTEETQSQDLAKLIYIAQMLSNDMKHIQYHAVGPYFDNIQNIAKELHNELECEIDDLMIEAMTKGLPIHNFNDIKSQVGEEEYEPLTNEMFDWNTFCDELSKRGGIYLKALCDSELPGFAKNDYIQFWNKEINYKTSLRAITPATDIEEVSEDGEEQESVLAPYFLSDGLPENEVDDPHEPLPAVDWRDLTIDAAWGHDIAHIEKPSDEPKEDEEDVEEESEEDGEDIDVSTTEDSEETEENSDEDEE